MLLPKRRLAPLLFLLLALLLVQAVSSASHVSARSAKARAASSFVVGVADEDPAMFNSPLFTQLNTRITRYITPYDAAVTPRDLALAHGFIDQAHSLGVQVLVAFYHSRNGRQAERMPSVSTYTADIKKFMKAFPFVTLYQPWNEANRGNVRGLFSSPSASQSAAYYVALKKACPRCTNIGLDVLDQPNVRPTLAYIRSFESAVRRLHTSLPGTWGLHNYSDTNRFTSSRTRAVLAAVPGNVWLTETGGVVQFGGAFPNHHGEGLTRAKKALQYMFSLARSNSRIKRLYIFDWSGTSSTERFDAGLVDPRGYPRPGYQVVCTYFHAKVCSTSALMNAGFPLAKD